MNLKHLPLIFLLTTILSQSLLQGQWRTEKMPQDRIQSIGAASEDKLFLPGGLSQNNFADDVAVYDIDSNTWSSMPLTEPRSMINATINADLLFCAGGTRFGRDLNFDNVEIYNTQTLELVETASLSVPRLGLAAVAVGDKVLFAGGASPEISGPNLLDFPVHATVDMYDLTTNTWSVAELSDARADMAHAVLGTKAYFAGGYKGNGLVSNVVDIYDAATDTWSTDTLCAARTFFGGGSGGGGTVFNNKIYFAGGTLENSETTTIIDIYDPSTDTWAIEHLSTPRAGVKAGVTSNHLLFAGGSSTTDLEGWLVTSTSNVVDIYDLEKEEWTTFEMEYERANHMVLSAKEQVFILSGLGIAASGRFILVPDMEIFRDEMSTSTENQWVNSIPLQVFPNPTDNQLFIALEYNQEKKTRLQLFDLMGRSKIDKIVNHQQLIQEDISQLSAGMYWLTLTNGAYQRKVKVVKH